MKVEVQPGGGTGNVSIDHHPRGRGFLTNYNHIDGIRVDVGEVVEEGEPIARVAGTLSEPHLHFELWTVIDRGEESPGDSDMVPVDPTRALYEWERRLAEDAPLSGLRVPVSVGVVRIHTIPFLAAGFEDGPPLHVPLYEPMTEDERLLVALLRDAHRRGSALELATRHSGFWGLDVVTQATLA